ncbi:conserved protein of unknown function [Agrobacterium pusense]|uniref:Uncharacterized protein n=1 Tax=Agrobacterium pusense TaxID=648995 RepID=U4Q4J6_9HYPH|nr:conserved protein of unknown function [Agrobacterium pusense]
MKRGRPYLFFNVFLIRTRARKGGKIKSKDVMFSCLLRGSLTKQGLAKAIETAS